MRWQWHSRHKVTGSTRLIILSDQENAVKNLVDMIRDSRTHGTAVIHTPKGSSARRANNEVEKQIRTLRSRSEENYGEIVGLDHKMLLHFWCGTVRGRSRIIR